MWEIGMLEYETSNIHRLFARSLHFSHRLLELVTCEEGSRSEATKELTSFKNQSKYGPNVSGAERFLKFLNPGRGNQLVLSN
ncbi:hypothetical protein ILYODFUR_006396, partial [Ilyodon furcidens]